LVWNKPPSQIFKIIYNNNKTAVIAVNLLTAAFPCISCFLKSRSIDIIILSLLEQQQQQQFKMIKQDRDYSSAAPNGLTIPLSTISSTISSTGDMSLPPPPPSPVNESPSTISAASPHTMIMARKLPMLAADYSPSNWDVICQRGKTCDDHIGNRRFRLCVDNHVERYLSARNRQEKSDVISSIVRAIQRSSSNGKGGFVMKVSKLVGVCVV
jgi:hypothetical protein